MTNVLSQEDQLKSTYNVARKNFVSLAELDDAELFDLFYCSRASEHDSLMRYLSSEGVGKGRNVVLVGKPGVGKTCFFSCIANQKQLLREKKVKVIIANSRKHQGLVPKDKYTHLKQDVIDGLLEYFTKLKMPLHKIDSKDYEDIDKKWYATRCHLFNSIKIEDQQELFPVLFIDDVDYLETEFQHLLLTEFAPFFSSQKMSVVYACRPCSFNEISYHLGDRPRITIASEQTMTIRLEPIAAQRILARRLSILLNINKSKKTVKRALRGLFAYGRRKKIRKLYQKYLSQSNLSIQDVQLIDYPFTNNQEDYIERLSDGDIRIMIAIADRLLEYIIENYYDEKKVQKIPNDGYHIGRDTIIGILTDFKYNRVKNPTPITYMNLYQIINIHEFKSKFIGKGKRQKRNSLFQNTEVSQKSSCGHA